MFRTLLGCWFCLPFGESCLFGLQYTVLGNGRRLRCPELCNLTRRRLGVVLVWFGGLKSMKLVGLAGPARLARFMGSLQAPRSASSASFVRPESSGRFALPPGGAVLPLRHGTGVCCMGHGIIRVGIGIFGWRMGVVPARSPIFTERRGLS